MHFKYVNFTVTVSQLTDMQVPENTENQSALLRGLDWALQALARRHGYTAAKCQTTSDIILACRRPGDQSECSKR